MSESIFAVVGAPLLFLPVNPWQASISFCIIWTFVSHFYFWQSTAEGLVMHCWFWRVERVSTSLSPAERFFSSLKCDLPCDWFTPTISQIMVHFRALTLRLFCLRAFLNAAQVCCPPFGHTYKIQLINNGQAANKRRPKFQKVLEIDDPVLRACNHNGEHACKSPMSPCSTAEGRCLCFPGEVWRIKAWF